MKPGDYVRLEGRLAKVTWIDVLPTDDIAIEYRDGTVAETKKSEVKPLNLDKFNTVSGRMSQ